MKRYADYTAQCIYNFDNITDFSLDTYPHYMASMAITVQWMNIMGFDFYILTSF